MNDFWKILRILTTNKCNYRCLYCHNEGQDKDHIKETLSFEEFLHMAHVIDGMGFEEIRFSGGEPLVNPKTIEMIEWLDANSDYEIGLATNGSLITEEIAERLGNTRAMVTIHFPAAGMETYQYITGKPNNDFLKGVELLEWYSVSHSFNFVLYPETISNMDMVIDSVIEKGKRIKLLPFIEEGFNNYSREIIENLRKRLDVSAMNKEVFEAGGITTWKFENGGKIKLLDSPCYDHDIQKCQEYGELRLLPDLSLQKCIFDKKTVSLVGLSDIEIKNIISDMWTSFDKCL